VICGVCRKPTYTAGRNESLHHERKQQGARVQLFRVQYGLFVPFAVINRLQGQIKWSKNGKRPDIFSIPERLPRSRKPPHPNVLPRGCHPQRRHRNALRRSYRKRAAENDKDAGGRSSYDPAARMLFIYKTKRRRGLNPLGAFYLRFRLSPRLHRCYLLQDEISSMRRRSKPVGSVVLRDRTGE